MALAVTAYEFWGDPTGDSTTVSANRTPVADLSLKALSDPNQLYYPFDIQRPPEFDAHDVIAQSFQRYISFRITGSYSILKNVVITMKKPGTFQKIGGIWTAISDTTQLMYKTTNVYQKPASSVNSFGNLNGAYDGTMNIITADTKIHPRLSSVSPVLATSRAINNFNAPSYWTEFIVLQGLVYPNTFDKVGTFGKMGSTVIGTDGPSNITGALISIAIDEVGSVVVN